jgi:hypothetical protein
MINNAIGIILAGRMINQRHHQNISMYQSHSGWRELERRKARERRELELRKRVENLKIKYNGAENKVQDK